MGRRIAVSSIVRHVPPLPVCGLLRVIELDSGRVLLTASIVLSADPLESVSSVAVIPDSFYDPPQRLRFARSATAP